jgi:hypothetical protein
MKICDLARLSGDTKVLAWPPRWATLFLEGDTWKSGPKPGEGVLESVMRHEDDDTLLRLTMRFEAREYTALLLWDGPPSLGAVESLLRAHVGRGIRSIGELELVAQADFAGRE